MKDFEKRFAGIFERICNWSWKGASVKTTVVEGRYPIDEETVQVSTKSSLKEHPSFKEMTFVVVELTYPQDYPIEDRDDLTGPIPFQCALCLNAIGLGYLLHNSNGRKDAYVIFTPISENVYKRLPPVGTWNGEV